MITKSKFSVTRGWLTQAQFEAEKEASRRRTAAKQIASVVRNNPNPQFSGLHLTMPRISLGSGGYRVHAKGGHWSWSSGA